MKNLNSHFLVEIKEEILYHALSDDTNYSYQEVGKILYKVRSVVSKHLSLNAGEYISSPLTANLRHSELEFNRFYWADGNKQDRIERLKWFANGYINALNGLSDTESISQL